jgi:hypothetical protein
MLRALLVLCLVAVSGPALTQEYQSKELADAARDWRRELIESVPVNKKQPALIAGWRRAAETDYQAKRYAAAIDQLTRAIANGADDGLAWLHPDPLPASGAREWLGGSSSPRPHPNPPSLAGEAREGANGAR